MIRKQLGGVVKLNMIARRSSLFGILN